MQWDWLGAHVTMVTNPTVTVNTAMTTVIVIKNTMIAITVATNIANREGLQIKSKPIPVAGVRTIVMGGG